MSGGELWAGDDFCVHLPPTPSPIYPLTAAFGHWRIEEDPDNTSVKWCQRISALLALALNQLLIINLWVNVFYNQPHQQRLVRVDDE